MATKKIKPATLTIESIKIKTSEAKNIDLRIDDALELRKQLNNLFYDSRPTVHSGASSERLESMYAMKSGDIADE
jgi:hypothetical protein